MITMMKSGAAVLGMAALAALGSSPASAVAGRAGWQGAFTYSVPAGASGLFFHYPCPAGFSVSAGGQQTNGAAQGNGMVFVTNGPRFDIGSYQEWSWGFNWPAGGAPAGAQITFDVNCKKGAP